MKAVTSALRVIFGATLIASLCTKSESAQSQRDDALPPKRPPAPSIGRGQFGRGLRFGPGWDYGFYDYGCGYGYPYYNLYSCYSPTY